MKGEQSVLRAILTADIQDFSRQMLENEQAVVRLLVDTYYAAVQRQVERYGGQVLRKEGDAVWCSFESALACMRTAVGIQEEIFLRNAQEGVKPVQLRVGAHLGDVTLTSDGEVLGHTLSVAKRLETYCTPGAICVSEDLYTQVSSRRLGFHFDSRGTVELRGVGAVKVWEASMTEQLRQALLAQAAEIGRAQVGPRLLLLADVSNLPEGRRTDWERQAQRCANRINGTLLQWDDTSSIIVADLSARSLELITDPKLEGPRRLLAAGEVLIKADDSGHIEELYGSSLERALEALEVGRQSDLIVLTPRAGELVAEAGHHVEPWDSAGIQDVHLYRLLGAEQPVLSQAHVPRRVTGATQDRLVDVVAGTDRVADDHTPDAVLSGLRATFGAGWSRLGPVLALESERELPQHPTLGLAVALAALASKHRDSLPPGLIAVGEVLPDGALSPLKHPPASLNAITDGLILGPPGSSSWGLSQVVELQNLGELREWMLRAHGHDRLFADSLRGGRLCIVLSGPLGGAEELDVLKRAVADEAGLPCPSDSSFPQLAEEAEEELGRALLLGLYTDWCKSLGTAPLEALLGSSNLALLVSLFPDPRVDHLSGKMRSVLLGDAPPALTESDSEAMFARLATLAGDIQRLLSSCTLLLIGCRGTETTLKGFFRQLRMHNPAGPDQKAFYLAPDCGEAEERWWERRDVELLRESPESVLASAAEARAAGPSPERRPIKRVKAQPRSPYKFLQSYGPADRVIFYGREEEVDQLMTRLLSHPSLIVYGKSGVGKTSLLQAGVHALLRRPANLMVSLRVLSEPMQLIRSRLLALSDPTPDGDEQPLHQLMNRLAGCISGHLVVLLDQFEELFVRHTPQARQGYLDELANTIRHLDPRCHIVFSMREDFLAEMSELETFLPTILDNRYRVRRLSATQARAAILGPAELFGLQISEEVVEDLINQLMEDGIDPPELQIALDALYRARDLGPDAITVDTYRRLGGVVPILVGYLQSTLARLGPDSERARALLKSLVTNRGTKAVVSLEEVAAALREPSGVVAELLGRLVEARLVRALEEGGEPRYELAHEYVISEVQSWTSDAEVTAQHAATVLRTELANWKRYGSLLSRDRLAFLKREAHLLEIGDQERNLLLRAAAVHGSSVETWLLPHGSLEERGVASLLAMLEDEELAGDVQRGILESLFALALPEQAQELLLRSAERVGNPYLLERLSQVAHDRMELLESVTRRVHRRFFGPARMAHVPGGGAWLGSSAENKAERIGGIRPDLHPRILSERDYGQVHVGEYWMDLTPVTNEDYAEFRPVHRHYFAPEERRLPVVYVSYFDALAFCEWCGKQLPSEEQWEKASRGTEGQLFPWGNEFSIERLNSAESGLRHLSSVDSHPEGASPYGCLNMSGLVWEWTQTPWEPGSPFMTKKGGCAINFAPLMQSSSRFEDLPELILQWVGFRACASRLPHF